MSQKKRKKESSIRTRKSIVNMLKENGSMDAISLASQLSVTGMAVRQHLYALQTEKIVEYTEESRPMGRPVKMWRLTNEANKFFPDGYAELTISLIDTMKETFGDEGLDRLLSVRNKKLQIQYLSQIAVASTIEEKLDLLAKIRTEEGYMAEIQKESDDSFLLIEKHCPICEVAQSCTQLCKNELELFQTVFGEDIQVDRSEHILSGDTRCVYRMQKNIKS